MPTYVMLANWTDQGVRAISESPRRVDAAKKELEDMGGQFRSVYMTMGEFDLVMIYDAPDNPAVHAHSRRDCFVAFASRNDRQRLCCIGACDRGYGRGEVAVHG
jgi:hypothetical protein